MHWFDERMKAQGQRVRFMAEYFLPDVNRMKKLQCSYTLKILYPEDFEKLYLPEWGNALCEARKEVDI